MTTEQCGQDQLPIGLFDSGVGGLTVLDAMRRLMPGEDYLFLGDTARVPYGAKSQKTIVRYSLQAAARSSPATTSSKKISAPADMSSARLPAEIHI